MESDSAVKLESNARGVILPVRANAGARRNGIVGVRNGALRVAVTAAPEKGKANRAIVEVLSKSLQMSKSSIELLSGETSTQKRFLLVGADATAVRAALAEVAS
jgi:uncharacterized protein (TIGR00251 family)